MIEYNLVIDGLVRASGDADEWKRRLAEFILEYEDADVFVFDTLNINLTEVSDGEAA